MRVLMDMHFGRRKGVSGRQIHPRAITEDGREGATRLSHDATLPGKTSKEKSRYPYRKRTHVDEMSILRRSGEGLFRNSAN